MLIERRFGNKIIGWVKKPVAALGGSLELTQDGAQVQTWPLCDLILPWEFPDISYFEISLANEEACEKLISGKSTLAIRQGSSVSEFRVFGSLRDTLALGKVNLDRLGSTFKLLSPSERHAYRRAVEYGTQSHIGSKIKKSTCCVITYANDSGGWFPTFHRHYQEHLGGTTGIYVVSPAPESFSQYSLGGIFGLQGFPYDDSARSEFFSNISAALRAYYEWVIVADVDELIIPDPRSQLRTIKQRLEEGDLDAINFSLGMDLIQAPDEEDYIPQLPPLEQRRYAVPNSGMCKPHISRGGVNYDIGFHYCQKPPKLPAPEKGFLMLHLKYACKKMQESVSKIVETTQYSDEKIRRYASSSLERSAHPGLKTASPATALPYSQWNQAEFQSRIDAGVRYNADRDMFIGKNFVDDIVIDLRSSPTPQTPHRKVGEGHKFVENPSQTTPSTKSWGFGTISDDGDVMVGRNGFLFLGQGSNKVKELYSFSSPSLVSKWAEIFANRKDRLDKLGAKYLQIIIPEKSSILAHLTPFDARNPSIFLDDLLGALKNHFDDNSIACPLIDQRSNLDSLFLRADSHLSTHGAKVSVQHFLRKLGLFLPAFEETWEQRLRRLDLGNHFPGDLREVVDEIAELKADGTPLTPNLIESIDPPTGHKGFVRHWNNENPVFDLSICCFGNSFFERGSTSSQLSWWFARLFREFRFEWNPNLNDSYISHRKFDIVFCQTIERFLRSTPEA